jgi:hypothetical protein
LCEKRESLAAASPGQPGQAPQLRISAELAAAGHLNERGRPFNPKSVKTMLER